VPPSYWANLVNFILHLEQPRKESWIGKDQNEIWLFGGERDSKHLLCSKPIDWLDDEVFIYDYRSIVRVLNCSSELTESPLSLFEQTVDQMPCLITNS
jgi:hypothetical protein